MSADLNTMWRHKKRGSTYRVRHIGVLQVNCGHVLPSGEALDNCDVVIYESVDSGDIYVRPLEEFLDGRFERTGK